MSRNWINFLIGIALILFAVLNLPTPLWFDRLFLIISGLVVALISFNLLNKDRQSQHGDSNDSESE